MQLLWLLRLTSYQEIPPAARPPPPAAPPTPPPESGVGVEEGGDVGEAKAAVGGEGAARVKPDAPP